MTLPAESAWQLQPLVVEGHYVPDWPGARIRQILVDSPAWRLSSGALIFWAEASLGSGTLKGLFSFHKGALRTVFTDKGPAPANQGKVKASLVHLDFLQARASTARASNDLVYVNVTINKPQPRRP